MTDSAPQQISTTVELPDDRWPREAALGGLNRLAREHGATGVTDVEYRYRSCYLTGWSRITATGTLVFDQ